MGLYIIDKITKNINVNITGNEILNLIIIYNFRTK